MSWYGKVALAAALTIACIAPGHAAAQEAAPDDGLLRLLRIADRGDDYIRIGLGDRHIEGRVHDLDSDSVRLASGVGAIEEIRFVEERSKHGGGAMVGAVTGGLLMMAALVPLAGLCESDCGTAAVSLALIGGSLGGTIGGLIGALVSPADVTWTPIWSATP